MSTDVRHSTATLGLLSMLWGGMAAAQDAPSGPQTVIFTVFVRGQSIGSERVLVEQSPQGWKITGSNSIGVPIGLALRHVEIEYDPSWHPRRMSLEGMAQSQPLNVKTTFEGSQAVSEILENGRLVPKRDPIAPDVVVLPNNFFGAYEAVAARLSSMAIGDDLPIYVAPVAETRLTLSAIEETRIQTPDRTIRVKRYFVSVQNQAGPLTLEVWADDAHRLARMSIPALGLDVVREDLATVAARLQTFWREGDIDVTIPANGFSLAGTVSRPRDAAATIRLPAIVLVGGSGPLDRDATMFGLPLFGQLAAMFADQGALVLRYDQRGVGQSGGRTESVTLADYAEDVRAAVRFLSERRDVDRKRVILAAHGEGAMVALLAARREKKVTGLVLLSAPAAAGADLVLEQQARALAKMSLSEADRAARIDLQKRIHQAVLTGEGWASIPPEMRRGADTPWFRSFLAFDPTQTMNELRQPVLVIHGELDRQIPRHHGDRSVELANARRNVRSTELVQLPGVNHLLTQAATGEVDEYPKLADKQVSAEVGQAVFRWLETTFGRAAQRGSN